MAKIKICGITNKIDAINASALGIDMMGFVFYKKSKRYIEPDVAADIIGELPSRIGKVGVFVDEDPAVMGEIAEETGLDVLQLHGSESPEVAGILKEDYKVIKAFRLTGRADLATVNDFDADYYLLDTYKADTIGGTGEVFDWKILKDFEFLRPVILSGGLNPDNVGRAIKEVVPYGVDVSTGVESSPGKKDKKLMRQFIEEVRRTE